MTTDHEGIALLAGIMAEHGVRHIVISPGSRNAPVILAFARHPHIEALSVIDERSAAFFALGMAQQLKNPVALACTSGTAALNYAPAIAEAYYQKIPLLVLTADRPREWTDQGDGQTIRQKGLYAQYIRAGFELPQELHTPDDHWYAGRIINEAIHRTMHPVCGPVHINMPLTEPLYGTTADPPRGRVIRTSATTTSVEQNDLVWLTERWISARKKLLLAGMMYPDQRLNRLLSHIAMDQDTIILTETTSNLHDERFLPCIDRVVSTIREEEAERFRPELLVTFGGPVISKMAKSFLRKHPPQQHWHIDPTDLHLDTSQHLTQNIPVNPAVFFSQLDTGTVSDNAHEQSFSAVWRNRHEIASENHRYFLESCDYSDLKVFEAIIHAIPEDHRVQLGNSTPVRYAQLFGWPGRNACFSNRGTSGIDGTVSTAAGAARTSGEPTVLITGDLGFLYDSNALMSHHLAPHLKIIVINNSGGGIFRFIPGPDQTGLLEPFFETHHGWRMEHLAINFGVPYRYACNLREVKDHLAELFQPEKSVPGILEIKTPAAKNAELLRDYFKKLAEKKSE